MWTDKAPDQLQPLLDQLEQSAQISVSDMYRQAVAKAGVDRSQMAAWEALKAEDVVLHGADAVAYRVGLDVAAYEQLDVAMPYHNNVHTVEVLASAGWLLSKDPTHRSSEQTHASAGLQLMTAMVAHDWGHQGHIPGAAVGTMEKMSADRLGAMWRRYDFNGQFETHLSQIREIILGTEFTQGPGRNAQTWTDHPDNLQAKMQVLANDSDVLPSVLPWTGPERGERLASEWRQCHLAAASVVATDAGRLHFLRMTPLRSDAAQVSGLEDVRLREMFVLARAVRVANQQTEAPNAAQKTSLSM